MAELTTIGFKAGTSPLHRLDPRTKQILLMVLSVASLWGNVWFLALTSTMLIIFISRAGLSLVQTAREIRYFLYFLLFIF